MLGWFCDVGGTIRASRIVPSLVERVAVPQDASRRLGPAVPDAGTRLHRDGGLLGFAGSGR